MEGGLKGVQADTCHSRREVKKGSAKRETKDEEN